MVVIRLARGGAKKRPFYNIVVADSRQARDGRYIERIGYFNPIAKGGEVRLLVEEERVTHWTSKGAQPSDRVISLLKQYKEQAAKVESATAADDKKAKKVAKKETETKAKSKKESAKKADTSESE